MRMSILSERNATGTQIEKAGGKIRAGIKVLTRNAAANPKAVEIYNKGVTEREKFSDIEKRIIAATGLSNPMYPRNSRYFNVAASDFGMPEIAQLILSKWGEVREGSVEKQLYRFPVVFHSDELEDIFPNQFKRYGFEPHYQSHYGQDDNRYCQYLPEVTKEMLAEQKASRIKRPPRRQMVIRGKCIPISCPEFLEGQCKFRGKLQFYIPGIPTTGLMTLETTSEYAAEAIWADLVRVKKVFGGIPRSNPNKPNSYIFYITKVQEERTYFDENGVKKKGLQWVPKLEADIDMGAVLALGSQLQLAQHTTPVAWLAKPKGLPTAPLLPQAQDAYVETVSSDGEVTQNSAIDPLELVKTEIFLLIDQLGATEEVVADYFDQKLGEDWQNSLSKLNQGLGFLNDLKRLGGPCANLIMLIAVKIAKLSIAQEQFQKYSNYRFGKGYTKSESNLTELHKTLTELSQGSPEMASEFIAAELENAAATN